MAIIDLTPKRQMLRIFLLALGLCLSALLYLPGVSGPYIFDDETNLLDNNYVRINSLDAASLYHAAFSLESGPLRRPIAMLSFALNYYFTGSFTDPAPYKLTNIAIHLLNGWLVFWLMRLVFLRLVPQGHTFDKRDKLETRATWLAFAVTFLWLVQPIQVSSVLYLVQRMTELAAFFTLAGLIAYITGREALAAGRPGLAALLVAVGIFVFGTLGLLSKENAVLLPIILLTMEFTLFPKEAPWNRWQRLVPFQRRLLLVGAALVAIIMIVGVMTYALPSYQSRNFTMAERVLTEGRVLFLYLSLILLPQIDRLGNQHDDLVLSTSLLDPWTTLPALIGHAILLFAALHYRKRLPFLSLGILWFYAGHLLESTVLPLEIAHEHRNYLPSLGVMLVIVGGVHHVLAHTQNTKIVWILPAVAVLFSGVTVLRSSQWGDSADFYRYEALHHPDSARSQSGYAKSLVTQGRYEEAINALDIAANLNPDDITPLLQISLIRSLQGMAPRPADQERILATLRSSTPLTASLFREIQNDLTCLATSCRTLQVPMEQWLTTILERKEKPGDASYYHYALGITLLSQNRVNDALQLFHRSHELDPSYLHPLFAMTNIYIQMGHIEGAEQALAMLRQANANNPYPRSREIDTVAADIERLKTRRN